MGFNEDLPVWLAEGIEPSESQKRDGWKEGVKPPAQWHNWWMNTSYEALKELQEKAETKEGSKAKSDKALSDAKQYAIPKTEKGSAGGVAKLDSDGKVIDANGNPVEGKVKSVNGETGEVELSASDVGAETPSDAQTKATKALTDAKEYTDEKFNSIEVTKESVGLGNVTNVAQASKQEFNDLKEKVEMHPEEAVTDEKGAHNFRITDGKAEYYKDDKWNRLRVGTPFRVGNVISPSINQKPGRVLGVSWQDPADLTMQDENNETVILTRWAGTQLRRKTGAYPVDENDGELVIDNKERGKYSSNSYQDEGLEDGTEYFYMLFPYTEEGEFTVDAANRIKEVAVTKLDRNAPSSLSVSNIEYDRATVTSNAGAVVSLDKNTWHRSPHTFTGLTEETNYTPYAKYPEDDTYYESPIRTGNTFETPSEAPGPGKLIAGNENAGFYGEVSSNELISGNDLASQIGLTAGTSQHSNEGWLKFAYEGKIQFVAKKTFRYGLSWSQINDVEAVHGDKEITIDGQRYKIRLMRGANKDPAGGYSGGVNHGSEWNKLMLPIREESIDKDWAYPGNVESDVPSWNHNLGSGKSNLYTDKDLHTHNNHGSGSYSWCQEVAENSSIRLLRGYIGVSYSFSTTSTSSKSSGGWRPVLELL